jgi:hypothetical protein
MSVHAAIARKRRPHSSGMFAADEAMRTLVVDSRAAASELATALVADGLHFTCAGLPGGGWAFSVTDAEPKALDALLVLASRAAARPQATAAVTLASR